MSPILNNSQNKFLVDKTATVAFMGGSITEMEGYRPLVCEKLQTLFSETHFTFINAGISSTTSTTGAFRFEHDILAKGPIDLLFVEFAVNDDQDGDHTREECIRGMEGIIRHAWRCNPLMDIVVTYFINEGMLATLQKGEAPARIKAHQTVVDHYRLPVVNLAQEVARALAAGTLTWEQYGGVHPGPVGHAFCARMMGELFLQAWENPLGINAKPEPHLLPAPLDPFNYEFGRYIEPGKALIKSGWTLAIPNWTNLPGEKRSWYMDKTMLSSSDPGSEVSLNFEGTALGAFIIAGPDAGQVEVCLDGGPTTIVNNFHSCSRGLHYPRTVMLATQLNAGKHTATLKIAPETSNGGHAMRIFQFTAN